MLKRWILSFAFILCLVPSSASAQQNPPPLADSLPPKAAPEEFLRVADEVLADMSRLLSLPVKAPLTKSIRTRDEIRAYVIAEIRADREPQKWYADQKALERFGLLPKDFPLEQFLVDLLTEQIAGLYDPKRKEFFIADWIGMEEQRGVLSHELVHALHDQHFAIESWLKGVKTNDDAMSARHAVLEGAAIAGMLDYLLRAQGITTRDLPDIEPLIRSQMGAEMDKNPLMAKAPLFIRDSLLFPYLEGTFFTQKVLQKGSGWADFNAVFAKPPDSTRQIMHPELYLNGTLVQAVSLPDASQLPRSEWKKLDENVIGEFGIRSVLKQFVGEDRAKSLAASWDGDLYGIYEHGKTKQSMLLFRLRLASLEAALRFFGVYSEALELKHSVREQLFRRPGFFSFETRQGGVFLYCHNEECFSMEGGSRSNFDLLVRELKWPAAPARTEAAPKTKAAIHERPTRRSAPSASLR